MTVATDSERNVQYSARAGANGAGPPATDTAESVLEVQDLCVAYRMRGEWVDVVRGISLDVQRGETYGIVGESGCGKSSTAFAIVDYLGPNGKVSGGQVLFQGEDLLAKRGEDLRSIPLRNGLLPTITVIAINVGWLMGGLIVVETVFAYPGMGQLLLLAAGNSDVPLLQAVTLIIAAIYAVANLIADLLYRTLNPQIRFQ